MTENATQKSTDEANENAIDNDNNDDFSPRPHKKPQLVAALQPFASILQAEHFAFKLPLLEDRPLPPSVCNSYPYPHEIICPLSPQSVCKILETPDGSTSDLSSPVVGRVYAGKPIWSGISYAVIQVSESVCVKVGPGLDHDEHAVLQFLEERVPSIPAPRALGLITVGSTSFLFMTLIPGATLEARWSSLSAEAKTDIRRAVDKHLLVLRQIEHPRNAPFGCPVGRRVCKDVRRDERSPRLFTPKLKSTTSSYTRHCLALRQLIRTGCAHRVHSRRPPSSERDGHRYTGRRNGAVGDHRLGSQWLLSRVLGALEGSEYAYNKGHERLVGLSASVHFRV